MDLRFHEEDVCVQENRRMIIGKNTETRKDVRIDLARLISTRLLIQANSGAGKSWLIRRILEQTHGKVQQIVLDLEGEFSTLREEYDYLLVGKDGEIPANIQTAELLAKKLLKLNVSTIIDLSELKHHERITFVKRFLDSLVNAPRELWHTCLVVVDEAHQFCPEGKMSESGSSVIDLQTRGRKRGFCGILATQRIAKLHKDAAAECNNVLVGRTVIDIDRKRASNDLGFTSKEQELSLKRMNDGEFYGYGPAISKEDYVKVKVGSVVTTHPEPGKSMLKASGTPANIKKLLKDVIDLPKEAEAELKTKKEFQNKISELKREVRVLNSSKPKPVADERALERARMQGSKETEREFNDKIHTLERSYKQIEKKLIDVGKIIGKEIPKYSFPEKTIVHPKESIVPRTQSKIEKVPSKDVLEGYEDVTLEDIRLGICARKIYSVLFGNQTLELTKVQLGLLSGYSTRSSGFSNALAQMNTMGLIKRDNGKISINEINEEYATERTEGISREEWAKNLGLCSKKIFQFLLEHDYEEFEKEHLAEEVSYSVNSSGFNNSLAQLNSLGLIQRNGRAIKLNPELLEL